MQKLIEKTHYPQESEYSCIRASIRMVFSAFEKGLGERYAELDLINLLGTSQRGSLLENLMRISKLGFQVEVVSSNLSELLAYLQAKKKPVIVVVYLTVRIRFEVNVELIAPVPLMARLRCVLRTANWSENCVNTNFNPLYLVGYITSRTQERLKARGFFSTYGHFASNVGFDFSSVGAASERFKH